MLMLTLFYSRIILYLLILLRTVVLFNLYKHVIRKIKNEGMHAVGRFFSVDESLEAIVTAVVRRGTRLRFISMFSPSSFFNTGHH